MLRQRLTLMPASALAGPPPTGLLARLNPGLKSHVEETEGAGWGLHGGGVQSLPARSRPLPSSQPGQPPSHAMLSLSASDAPRGAPRFFHQKSQKQNEKQIRPKAAGPGPLPTPMEEGPQPSPQPIRCQDPRSRRLRQEGPLLTCDSPSTAWEGNE